MNQEYFGIIPEWWSLYYSSTRHIHGWFADLPANQP
jgi:hypothetical protein